MNYFPQLSTGAPGQFPVRKIRTARTVVNTMPDGHTVKYADPGADQISWLLTYQSLSDTELDAFQQFFQATEGTLNGFTFLDPTDNLLAWSETLDQPAWQVSSLVQLQSNIADPLGSMRATRITNTSEATLGIEQDLNAPGWFTYCFSVYARADQAIPLDLSIQTDVGTQTETYQAGAGWQRFLISGNSSTTAPSIMFGLTIPPGASADIFGLQVEAQPSASTYKPTQESGGIYATARFDSDSFALTTASPNQNSCSVKIIAPPN